MAEREPGELVSGLNLFDGDFKFRPRQRLILALERKTDRALLGLDLGVLYAFLDGCLCGRMRSTVGDLVPELLGICAGQGDPAKRGRMNAHLASFNGRKVPTHGGNMSPQW